MSLIRRHSQDFSREHHEELLLGWKIKRGLAKGIDAERIAQYCKKFYEQYLSKHMEKEERYIFSKLHPADPDAIKLKKEHQQVKLIIYGLGQDPVNTLDFLKILAQDLDTHIKYEERVFSERLQIEIGDDSSLVMNLEDEHLKETLDWEDCYW